MPIIIELHRGKRFKSPAGVCKCYFFASAVVIVVALENIRLSIFLLLLPLPPTVSFARISVFYGTCNAHLSRVHLFHAEE